MTHQMSAHSRSKDLDTHIAEMAFTTKTLVSVSGWDVPIDHIVLKEDNP